MPPGENVGGLQQPVELLDGKIIDGRNRYRACEQLGIEVRTVKVNTEDPAAYVISRNLHRLHLSPSQRAMASAGSIGFYEEAADKRLQASGGDKKSAKAKRKSGRANLPDPNKGRARDQAGRDFEVSGKSVDMARKVLDKGTPQLVKAVAACRVAVGAAARS